MASQPSPDAALRLRALTHPLRWKLLDLVTSEGSATVTRCSQALGESTASCSYHLSILGKYGYLQQITDAPGREKPWTLLERTQDLSPQGPDVEDRLVSEAAMETFLDHEFDRTKTRYRLRDNEPEEWADASTIAGSTMWVTPEELQEITDALVTLIHRHERRTENARLRPEGAREARVFISTSVRPRQ
jgi:hypothetical protein